ncbi:unnamed protein product, partial [marine sediment metagenome]
MLKRRRIKAVILIITGLLILSVPNILFNKLIDDFDDQDNYSDYFNSNLLIVILETSNSITGVSDE